MVSSIMVGVSPTAPSQAAVDYSIGLARRYGPSLIGVGVIDEPQLVPPESVPLGSGPFKLERDEAILKAADETIDQVLAEFSRRCAAEGIDSRTLKLNGNPAALLAMESQRVDLLLVGTKHLTEGGWDSGSHTLRSILHHAPRPVLCVPESPRHGPKALIAYDGSLQAAKTLQLFLASGMAKERNLHLLTVAHDAQRIAERGIEFVRSHGRNVHTHIEEGGDAAQRILQIAESLGAGMIVMGAYGKPLVSEFVFGSVTRSILRQTNVPLFLYH